MTTPAAPRNTEEQLVRLIFPLLLRKDGQPRKRQPDLNVGMNGRVVRIPRGVVVEAPAWVQSVTDGPMVAFARQVRGGIRGADYYECFVSHRKPDGSGKGRP
jgi:hypothetical protein